MTVFSSKQGITKKNLLIITIKDQVDNIILRYINWIEV
jgi:hypothetical protein